MNEETEQPLPTDEWVDLQAAFADAEIVDLVHPDDAHDDEWVSNMLRSLRSMDRTVDAIRTKRLAHVVAATEEAAYFQRRTFDALLAESVRRRAVLCEWAIKQRARTGVASFQFPGGFIKTKHVTERWEWPDDESTLVEWLKEAQWQDLLRVSYKVDKVALKQEAVVKDGIALLGGETIPGVSVSDQVTASVML